MGRSLFSRIARYQPTTNRDPREDRLTEICAAVFEADDHVRGLAAYVASAWLRSPAAAASSDGERLMALGDLLSDWTGRWEVAVRTQRVLRAMERRRVDLELMFTRRSKGGARREITLWMEIKNGHEPDRDQLRAYLTAQREMHLRDATVLLIAPRADYLSFRPTQMPPQVPKITWEETGRAISGFTPEDPVGRFLCDELVAYLREKALMDPRELTPAHVSALGNYAEGMKALIRICELANTEVSRRWAESDGHDTWPQRRGPPREYWWSYPESDGRRAVTGPPGSGLVWELFVDSSELLADGRPGVPLFTAGLSWDGSAMGQIDDQTLDRFDERGFLSLPLGSSKSRQHEYVLRTIYPEELLPSGDLPSQAHLLAGWIYESFVDLSWATEPAIRRRLR